MATARMAFRSLGRSILPKAALTPVCRTPQHLKLLLPPDQRKPSLRPFSISPQVRREAESTPSSSGIAPAKRYTYQEIADLSSSPSPNRILIDVREPSELLATGRIPTAKSVPISSAPDAFFMPAEDFATKFGFARPGEGDEVIFYCKAGVRSRQAALLAGQARPLFGGKVGEYPGSWLDWAGQGGKVEKEGDQAEDSALNPTGTPSTPRP